MPIVADGQLNLSALTVDDIYTIIVAPQTPLVVGVPTDGIGLVGTAMRGEPNKAIPISDVQSAVKAFGDLNNSQFDIVTELIGALKQGANNIWAVRVTDGTDVKATKTILDSTSATAITLTAKTSGTWGTGIYGALSVGSNSTAVQATGSITVASLVAAQTLILTINGTAITTYTVGASDTPAGVAAALCTTINANTTVNKIISASVSGAVITLTALTPGTIGNAYTLAKSGTGSASMTLSGATLSGGSATPSWKLTIASAYDNPEIFDNIVVGSFGTIHAAIVDAVNNGISGQRPASAIVSAVVTSSSNNLIVQNALTAGTSGADGRSGVNSSVMLGNDGLTRTGMYALRGLPILQFGLAGLTDSTAWPTMATFAKDEGLLAVLVQPDGTSATTAVSNKQASLIDDWHVFWVKDHLWLNDTKNGLIRAVSPLGATLGRIATQSPERSPANKPVYGYLGTTRTGYVAANGTVVAAQPYGYAEISLLTSNGISFMNPGVGGDYLALRHAQNGSTNPTTNGLNYTRMTIFLSKSLTKFAGFAVDEVHTPELRRRLKSAISAFLASLATPGPGRAPMIGDVNGGPAYSLKCDKSNNPDNTVAQGYLYLYAQVKYLSIVRFLVLSVEAGQSVTVTVQSSPVAA